MKTNNNFTILIVDDEEINTELASLYLQEEKYRIKTALSAQDALNIISLEDISLILLDINMPGVDGLQLCSMLKAEKKTQDIPVIFLTAQTDISFVSKAFEAGGADYITKPFNVLELKARVKVQLQNIAYLDEIKAKQSKLAQLSITDPLSKLYNNLYFDAQLKTKLLGGENFWIFYIKINHMERLNTLYGFGNTNKLIRLFSKVLERTLFKNATTARLFSAHYASINNNYSLEDMKKQYKILIDTIKKESALKENINLSCILYPVDAKKETGIQNIYKKIQKTLAKMQNDDIKLMVLR